MAEGVPPTVTALRKRIQELHGVTASTATVTDELSVFWRAVGARLSKSEQGPDTEAIDISKFFPEAQGVGRDLAKITEELTALQYAKLELTARNIRLMSELEQVRRQLDEKDGLLSQAVLASGTAASRVEQLERRLEDVAAEARAEVEARTRAWLTELEKVKSELTSTREQLHTERQNSQTSRLELDGTRRHLMLETDRVRSQAEAVASNLKRELETARLREQQYLQQRNGALARVAELEQALENAGQRSSHAVSGKIQTPAAAPKAQSTAPTRAHVAGVVRKPLSSADPDAPYE